MEHSLLELIREFDENVLRLFQDKLDNDTFQKIMILITRLGDMGAIWVAPGIVLACSKEQRRVGAELLATLAAGGIINSLVIKNIVDRTRPFDIHMWLDVLISKPTDFSFPSGHTASSFAAAYIINKNYGKKYGIPAYTLATAIGLSRVSVGVHFPSDVIAGAAVGTAVAVGTSKLIKTLWAARDAKRQKKIADAPEAEVVEKRKKRVRLRIIRRKK